MPSAPHVHWLCACAEKIVRALVAPSAALLMIGLSACSVDFKDGVFSCSTSADCPSGLQCDPLAKRCTRHASDSLGSDATEQPDGGRKRPLDSDAGVGRRPDAAASNGLADAASSRAGSSMTSPGGSIDAGMTTPGGSTGAGMTTPGGSMGAGMTTPGGSTGAGPQDAGQPPTRAGEGGASGDRPSSSGQTRTAAGSGGTAAGAGGSGAARSGVAGGWGGATAEADSGAPTVPQRMPADCPQDTYCYGFESGALDPSGALWPSPSDGSGGLPAHGELTTATYPAGSRNAMLVSKPSSQDGWPKATVGFSGPRTAFSKLVVSFDYAAGEKLVMPNPRVILFRFVGVPERNGDSVNVGVLGENVMLEVQMEGPDPLSAIGRASAPGVLTHVVATFARSPGSCSVSVAYADLPLAAAEFPCDVQNWQIELGLDMLETPPEKYNDEYVAYFDNLQVSATP